jgi:hypothetical protein
MPLRIGLHTALAFLVLLALAFAWQAFAQGEGITGTGASLAAILGHQN